MNFINLVHNLSEKRSHSEINNTDLTPLDFIKSIQGEDLSKIFMTFTTFPKFSINPLNRYDTPTGIYAYQLSEFNDLILSSRGFRDIPFNSNLPYVIFFKPLNNNIINLQHYTNWDRDLNILRKTYQEEIDHIPQDAIERYNDYISHKINFNVPEHRGLKKLNDKVNELISNANSQSCYAALTFKKLETNSLNLRQIQIKGVPSDVSALRKSVALIMFPGQSFYNVSGKTANSFLIRLEEHITGLKNISGSESLESLIKERIQILENLHEYILSHQDQLNKFNLYSLTQLLYIQSTFVQDSEECQQPMS
jgi:hypothetical protein